MWLVVLYCNGSNKMSKASISRKMQFRARSRMFSKLTAIL
jgi:hypothetical protein